MPMQSITRWRPAIDRLLSSDALLGAALGAAHFGSPADAAVMTPAHWRIARPQPPRPYWWRHAAPHPAVRTVRAVPRQPSINQDEA